MDCVIVTFNSLRVIDGCLTSFASTGGTLSHIYIVDNNSTDGTVAYIRRNYPEIKVVQNATNPGFSAANNLGAREGSSELVMFANPDVIFQQGAVREMAKALVSDRSVGLCGPLIVDQELRPKRESYGYPLNIRGLLLMQTYLWNPVYRFRSFLDRTLGSEAPRKRSFISGACMLIRREDFERLGGFDERFFMYAEDADLCERVLQAGLKIVQVPKARMVHFGGGNYRDSRTVLLNSLSSRDTLHLKNSGTPALVIKRLLVALGLVLRWTVYGLLWRADKSGDREVTARIMEGLRPFISRNLLARKPLDFPSTNGD